MNCSRSLPQDWCVNEFQNSASSMASLISVLKDFSARRYRRRVCKNQANSSYLLISTSRWSKKSRWPHSISCEPRCLLYCRPRPGGNLSHTDTAQPIALLRRRVRLRDSTKVSLLIGVRAGAWPPSQAGQSCWKDSNTKEWLALVQSQGSLVSLAASRRRLGGAGHGAHRSESAERRGRQQQREFQVDRQQLHIHHPAHALGKSQIAKAPSLDTRHDPFALEQPARCLQYHLQQQHEQHSEVVGELPPRSLHKLTPSEPAHPSEAERLSRSDAEEQPMWSVRHYQRHIHEQAKNHATNESAQKNHSSVVWWRLRVQLVRLYAWCTWHEW